MNPKRLDLNLLLAFDALMEARHVTRAAQRLSVGQPAMSAALARLRDMFGDELLVKHGNRMLPTPRALALEPEVRRLLKEMTALVSDTGPFDPATLNRTVVVRLSDLLASILLPHALEKIRAAAPALKLDVVHLSPHATVDALERNSVDLAVSTGLTVPESIDFEPLFTDRLVVVARRGHPRLRELDSVDGLLAVQHVNVAQSPIDDRFDARELRSVTARRTVVATLPTWLAVPAIVTASDLVAIMPLSLATRLQTAHDIELIAPPFARPAFTWSVYWHRRVSADPASVWLRGIFTRAAANHADSLASN